MKGYFARKAENIEVVRAAIGESKRARFKPVEITAIGNIILSLDEYIRFCDDLLEPWEFLKPYAEKTVFTGDNKAKCVLVGAAGQHYIAVCMEGYEYARYTAWPFV